MSLSIESRAAPRSGAGPSRWSTRPSRPRRSSATRSAANEQPGRIGRPAIVMSDALVPEDTNARAVILAGGRGTRLAPYTSVLPKPLMPIGDRAILELVVDQLTSVGIRDFTFCVGHLAHLIRAVFDHDHTPQPRETRISYVYEEEPLGTAGSLKLVGGLDE